MLHAQVTRASGEFATMASSSSSVPRASTSNLVEGYKQVAYRFVEPREKLSHHLHFLAVRLTFLFEPSSTDVVSSVYGTSGEISKIPESSPVHTRDSLFPEGVKRISLNFAPPSNFDIVGPCKVSISDSSLHRASDDMSITQRCSQKILVPFCVPGFQEFGSRIFLLAQYFLDG